MPPWTGRECPTCHQKYTSLYEHLESCTPENVFVYIFGPEYECPGHYEWTPGPLGDSPCYEDNKYLIPLDTYLRWQLVQDDWERMNEEMHQLTGKI